VGVSVGVREGEAVRVEVGVSPSRELVGSGDTEGLPLATTLPLAVEVREIITPVSVGDSEGEAVADPVPLGQPVWEGEGVAVSTPVASPEAEGRVVSTGEAVLTAESLGSPVDRGDAVGFAGEEVGVKVDSGDAPLPTPLAVTVPLALKGDVLHRGVSEPVLQADTLEVGVSVGAVDLVG